MHAEFPSSCSRWLYYNLFWPSQKVDHHMDVFYLEIACLNVVVRFRRINLSYNFINLNWNPRAATRDQQEIWDNEESNGNWRQIASLAPQQCSTAICRIRKHHNKQSFIFVNIITRQKNVTMLHKWRYIFFQIYHIRAIHAHIQAF